MMTTIYSARDCARNPLFCVAFEKYILTRIFRTPHDFFVEEAQKLTPRAKLKQVDDIQ